MKKAAIIGATGYTGQELVRLLLQHDQIEIEALTSRSFNGAKFSSVYPNAVHFSELVCSEADIEKLSTQVDVMFVALPHGNAAKTITERVLSNCCIIDLGADFRLKNSDDYKTWYQLDHASPALLKDAVYGLPELNRADIKGARLVANPGCYATCSILTVAPALSKKLIDTNSIIIDAKSGVTGAGRSVSLGVHFDEVNESFKAYKVASHRHTPEIEQVLSEHSETPIKLTFTPHLVPMNRGILVTAYASLKPGVTIAQVKDAYASAYKDEFFLRICDGNPDYPFPETRWVKGSNFCDIGVTVDERTNRLIAIGAIDNLVKGAAGQAIQNMNLLFGFAEQTGLRQMPIFPA